MLCSITKSIEDFFKNRSPVSILNWVSYFATSKAVSSLDDLLLEQALQPTSVSTPILSLDVSLAPGAFVAIQMLQSSHVVENTHNPAPWKLNKIQPCKSLLTLYLSKLRCSTLIHTSSDIKVVEEKEAEEQSSYLKISSVKISTQLTCPVVQLDLAALVKPQGTEPLGLASGQQQLDFTLRSPVSQCETLVVCDLLEAGLKDTSLTCAAQIYHSGLSNKTILTWSSVQKGFSSSVTDNREIRKNQIAINMCVPVLWCQIAAPRCGLPQPTSSGLDLLVICEVVQAWQDAVRVCSKALGQLRQTKANRDSEVFLTLFSNAMRDCLKTKAFNPVLCQVAAMYRDTVLFSCLHQMWSSLPFFSEISVPHSLEEDKLKCSSQLTALLLGLATKLYSWQGLRQSDHRPHSPAMQSRELSSASTAGYVSISPSPSDMATLNRLYPNIHHLEDEPDVTMFSLVSYNTLVLLREALLPIFSAIGLKVEHQIEVPHLSTSKSSLDFILELKEATVFALESMQDTPDSVPAHLAVPTPALMVEQVLLNGCLKHSSELETPSSSATLLPKSESVVPRQTKKGLLSNCCVTMETIHVTVTGALLKIVKHASVTGRLRRKAALQAKLNAMDEMVTPKPPPSATTPAASQVIKYASGIVNQLSSLEGKVVSTVDDNTLQAAASDSTARVIEYMGSPPKARNLSPAQATPTTLLLETSGNTDVRAAPVNPSLRLSNSSLSSRDFPPNVVIAMEDTNEGTSPEDVLSTMDTCGEDTTDSQHIISSDYDGTTSPTLTTSHTALHAEHSAGHTSLNEPHPLDHSHSLLLPHSNLSLSVFGLLKLSTLKFEVVIETTKALLELSKISAAVDTREAIPQQHSTVPAATNLSLLIQILPTYLSIAVTLNRTMLRVSDQGLPDSDLVQMVLFPLYGSISICNPVPVTPSYRCLLKLTSLQVDIKQSAVKVHKRFQQLMPDFTRIYHEIFGNPQEVMSEAYFAPSSPLNAQVLKVDGVLKMPAKLPQGFINFSLDKTVVCVVPLPSLTVTYSVSRNHL